MGSLSRTLLAACALAAAPVTGAAASDFKFPPGPVVAVPSAIAVPDYTNLWYLRGDIGYALNQDPDISSPGTSFGGTEMDETWSFGAGLGYNFRDNLRGDITIDRRLETDMKGTNPATGAVSRVSLTSTLALANLYYEFRDRESFSPYVGAGLGFTYNETDTSSGAGDEMSDLAAAAMAGFSYRLDSQWLFDAGYRFLYLGEAQTSSNATTGALTVEDIFSHELRFGFRYELN